MKNLRLRVFQLLLVILTVGQAQLSAQDAKSLLWEISGKDLTTPSYLYGTVHLICPDDFAMGENIKTAFKKTEQVVLELDMDDQQEMMGLQMAMLKQEGVDYKGMMSEEHYQQLDALLKEKLGVGLQLMSRSKPFALMSVLYLTILDCQQPESYELRFVQMAGEQEKEILGLETGAFQMSIFDDIPEDEQIGWIVDMLDNPQEGREEWNELIKNYKAQDIAALYNTMGQSPEYQKYEKELLDNRNEDWIPKMATMAKEKSTFFAVGAMHLGGPKGVIKLLKEAGYTVKAVSAN